MAVQRKAAAKPAKDHPFVTRLNRSVELDDADMAALDLLLRCRVVARKARDLVVEGYEYRALHIVESGFAIRYKLLHNGKRQIVNVIVPGDIIGFPACFYEYAVFSVTALGDMRLHHVPLDSFTDLCLSRPNIATALVWFAAREAAIYAEHVIDTGRRDPLERLAHFLLEMLTRLQAVGGASERTFEMPLSQEGIGDVVGLSGPHVSRMLGELRNQGLIAVSGHQITVLDMAALQILGEFRSGYLDRVPVRGRRR